MSCSWALGSNAAPYGHAAAAGRRSLRVHPQEWNANRARAPPCRFWDIPEDGIQGWYHGRVAAVDSGAHMAVDNPAEVLDAHTFYVLVK